MPGHLLLPAILLALPAAESGPPPREVRTIPLPPGVVAELGVEPPAGHSLPTPSLLRWSADGKRLLVVYPGTRTWRSLEEQGYTSGSQRSRPRHPTPSVLAVWDVARGEVVGRRECPGRVIDATLDRAGTTVRAAGDDYTFRTWSLGPPATETETTLDPKPTFSPDRVIELLPDGRLVTWLPPGTSLVADVYDATGKRVMSRTVAGRQPPLRARMVGEPPVIPLRPEPGVVIFPDGRRTDVVSGRRLPALELREPNTLTGRRRRVVADAALIAFPIEFTGIHVWESSTGRLVGQMSDSYPERTAAVLSPDGRWLAGANQDVVEFRSARLGVEPVRLPIQRAVALAFSPDGARLAVAQAGDGVRVWRVPAPTSNRDPERTPDDLWATLARSDAPAAWEALWHLLDHPPEATALLASRLKPAGGRDTAEQIARLDDDRYPVREAASKTLAGRAEAVEDDLRLALRKPKSEEQRIRLEALLGKLDPATPPEGEHLRALRAVWLLERLGTPEAKKLLERLAGGAAGSRVTREAKAALERVR
jgi:hypothetical protein